MDKSQHSAQRIYSSTLARTACAALLATDDTLDAAEAMCCATPSGLGVAPTARIADRVASCSWLEATEAKDAALALASLATEAAEAETSDSGGRLAETADEATDASEAALALATLASDAADADASDSDGRLAEAIDEAAAAMEAATTDARLYALSACSFRDSGVTDMPTALAAPLVAACMLELMASSTGVVLTSADTTDAANAEMRAAATDNLTAASDARDAADALATL